MDRYDITFATWNKVASLYQEKFMELDLYNDTYDTFCAALEFRQPKILEVGCGPGNITKYLLAKRPDFNIDGIDVAPAMVSLAKNNNPTANFMVMDCRELSMLEKQYDGIVCGFCLPYLSHLDCSALFNNCKQILNDNGVFYVSFVDGEYDKSGFQVGSSGDKIYFYYHSIDYIKNEMGNIGFEIINLVQKQFDRQNGLSEIHTIIIAQKRPQMVELY